MNEIHTRKQIRNLLASASLPTGGRAVTVAILLLTSLACSGLAAGAMARFGPLSARSYETIVAEAATTAQRLGKPRATILRALAAKKDVARITSLSEDDAPDAVAYLKSLNSLAGTPN